MSYGSYEFESAIRCSVIVGAVGGGGIGTELVGTINALDYRRATTIILLLIALIAVIDACARWIKQKPRSFVRRLSARRHRILGGPAKHARLLALDFHFRRDASPRIAADARCHEAPEAFARDRGDRAGRHVFRHARRAAVRSGAARNFVPPWISLPVRRLLEGFARHSRIGLGIGAGECHRHRP